MGWGVSGPPFKAPMVWFGGKSAVAAEVWSRLGSPSHYIEPFAGSLAVLLARPDWRPGPRQFTETVNDADGLLCNFWRAVAQSPDAVAEAADWPVFELDLHARHAELIARRVEVAERLRADPRWCDPELAGWWVWGAGAWIGDGWGHMAARKMPHISAPGMGVHRITSNRRAVVLSVAERLQHMRVLCGDWRRAVAKSACESWGNGDVGVFLDPPYGEGSMEYAAGGNEGGCIAADVWAWAVETATPAQVGPKRSQRDPVVRVCVAGYEDGREVPEGWVTVEWDANASARGAGYGNQSTTTEARANARRERLWFSPACIDPTRQMGLGL
jgi:DNA adenine methylase